MADARPFQDVKLICGIIAPARQTLDTAERRLVKEFGPSDTRSPHFSFDWTDYYERQMGIPLTRIFLSFERLISPERLSDIKLRTNRWEEEIRRKTGKSHRAVNIDPGILTASALVMATAKDFAHRIPLQQGIYGHLELLFGKNRVRFLEWTYPDFRSEGYQRYFLQVRSLYLQQLRR